MSLGLGSPEARPPLAFAHILDRWVFFHIERVGWVLAVATKRILLMERENGMPAITQLIRKLRAK